MKSLMDPSCLPARATPEGPNRYGPRVLPPRAVISTSTRPKCRLPKRLHLAPSRRPLLRYFRWERPGYIPSRDLCEVRAEISGQVRTHPGRLQRKLAPPFIASPFVAIFLW